ncbi:MAG: hypothetical protein ACR2N2_04690 [Acidimicrobiia bacterium]
MGRSSFRWRVSAACVVLALGGAACSSGGSVEDLVEDWFVAYESGDAASYQSMMSREMTFLCRNCGHDRAVTRYFDPTGGADLDVRDSRLLALGDGTLNPVCEADDNVVTCATERISAFGFFTDEGEPTQTDRSTYEFAVSDGAITHLTVTRVSSGNIFDFGKIQSYRLWVERTHPDVYDDLFFSSTILIGTDEQWRRHQDLAPAFLASL